MIEKMKIYLILETIIDGYSYTINQIKLFITVWYRAHCNIRIINNGFSIIYNSSNMVG